MRRQVRRARLPYPLCGILLPFASPSPLPTRSHVVQATADLAAHLGTPFLVELLTALGPTPTARLVGCMGGGTTGRVAGAMGPQAVADIVRGVGTRGIGQLVVAMGVRLTAGGLTGRCGRGARFIAVGGKEGCVVASLPS